jgi:hypothetical protein
MVVVKVEISRWVYSATASEGNGLRNIKLHERGGYQAR